MRYFLGIEVARTMEDICLSQRKYMLNLLTETEMIWCKMASTLIEQNCKLSTEGGDPVNMEQYQMLVG